MKKFAVFNKLCDSSEKIKSELIQSLTSKGFEQDDINPEFVFVIGGDGAVIRAVRKYIKLIKSVQFITIHDGTLGFYADFQKEDIKNIADFINQNSGKKIKRRLIEMCISTELDKRTKLYALNEVRVESIEQTLITEVYVNNSHLETFRGNGFCFCTPSGSTAYNKSLGGAIIPNKLNVFEMTEIASINNNKFHGLNSSLILSNKDVITLKPVKDLYYCVGADTDFFRDKNCFYKNNNDSIKQIDIYLSSKNATFIAKKENHFVERLKKSFII